MAQSTSSLPRSVLAENLSVSVPAAGTTEVLTLPLDGITEVGIEFTVATQALDAFQVHGQMHPSGAFQALYDTAGDYTTPIGLVIGTSGDLTAQAAGTTGWIILDVAPLYALKIKVSAAADSAVVSVRAIGKGA